MTVQLVGMPDLPEVTVTEEDVTNALAACRFVLNKQLPALKTADQWWNEEVHNRRVKDGSPKATAWLEPFVPADLIRQLPLTSATNPRGPLAAGLVVKELRAAIRERRKNKEPHEQLLRTLHAACVLEDFVRELPFEFVYAGQLSCHLSLDDWTSAPLSYEEVGYAHVPTLAKTDVKWLVAALGEPRAQRAPKDALATLRETAISRYCWSELTRENESFRSSNPMGMEAWLRQRLAGTVRIRKENEALMARRAVRRERDERVFQDLPRAWQATESEFVVADLETTGLSSNSDDILEFGAVRVSPDGHVLSEFSALVNVGYELSPFISRLTGITTEEMRRNGRPLADAMQQFKAFAGERAVFFHNSYFDEGFLAKAAERGAAKLSGPIFDTLMLARAAWPDSESLKLRDLTEHLGVPQPTHRGVPDAKAALAVLLAARQQVRSHTKESAAET
jgi:DNA polymerase-3 subunit epsilon